MIQWAQTKGNLSNTNYYSNPILCPRLDKFWYWIPHCCLLHRKKKGPSVVLYLFGSALRYCSGGMDLQLGLAVSRSSAKGFDLNCSEVDFKEQCNVKKRSFDEAFEEKIADNSCVPDQTLPLLLWNDQPDRGEDEDGLDKSSMVINKAERNADGSVGWPPLNPWRKRICHQNRRESFNINCVTVENGGNGTATANRGNNSLYVKVKMEGVGIARKVDLSLHHSHDSLLNTLIAMFGKCQESFHSYLLTFQDKEGDWQAVDDVPWRVFIMSVQRLKLQRKND